MWSLAAAGDSLPPDPSEHAGVSAALNLQELLRTIISSPTSRERLLLRSFVSWVYSGMWAQEPGSQGAARFSWDDNNSAACIDVMECHQSLRDVEYWGY